MTVVQEVGCEVDIRAFLVGLDNAHKLRQARDGLRERHHDLVGQEVAKVDFNVPDGAQCPEKCLLPEGAERISRTAMYAGREILDTLNLVTGQEDVAKFGDVEPFVGRAFDAAEIKIEAVHVNPGLQAGPALKST